MVKEPYACLWLPTHCYTPKREQTPNKKWPPVTPKKKYYTGMLWWRISAQIAIIINLPKDSNPIFFLISLSLKWNSHCHCACQAKSNSLSLGVLFPFCFSYLEGEPSKCKWTFFFISLIYLFSFFLGSFF